MKSVEQIFDGKRSRTVLDSVLRMEKVGVVEPKTERKYTVERVVKKKVAAKQLARELLVLGASVRRCMEATGLAHNTVLKLRKLVGPDILPCSCGKLAGHRGWCRELYQRSVARHGVMARLHARQRMEG